MDSPSTATRSARPRHRKRSSLRLSSDSTVSALPAYASPPLSVASTLWEDTDPLPSDKPPDYPDSAEEADESDSDNPVLYLPPRRPTSLSPRRRPHVRRKSSDQLDSLLQRSIQALEMSNTLLQSNISTRTSLAPLLDADTSDVEPITRSRDLPRRTKPKDMTLRPSRYRDASAGWMDEIDEVAQEVEELFGESNDEGPVSRSLPTSSSLPATLRARHRPRHSIDSRAPSEPAPLTLSNHHRNDFISPPPRAVTLYVNSTDDPDAIALPSTLGLRSASATYASTPTTRRPLQPARPYIHATSSTSCLPDRISEASTPKASSILSSFLNRTPSPGSAFSFLSRRSSGASKAPSTPRAPEASSSSSSPTRRRRGSDSASRSRSVTPQRRGSEPFPLQGPGARVMTAIQELPSSQSSRSSSDLEAQPDVHRTLQSLRKIMDAQPPPPPPPRPRFMPRSPAPAPASGTSNATASVSRLLTKNVHTTSTRERSPPRQSSLKGTRGSLSEPATPSMSAAGSVPSSAASTMPSTPRRISFAELPESYAQSKPGGPTIKKKRKGKGRKEEGGEGGGWWTGWLLGAAGTSGGSGLSHGAQREERIEERIAGRTWGANTRPGYGGLDEWSV